MGGGGANRQNVGAQAISGGDTLQLPVVSLETSADYLDRLQGAFAVPGQTLPMELFHASEQVAFGMDESGARLVAQASLVAGPFGDIDEEKPGKPRWFLFDEPFFLMSWKDGAPMPYLAIYVRGMDCLRKWPSP